MSTSYPPEAIHLADLFEDLKARLGLDYFTGKGGTEFEVTPQGRCAIRTGGGVTFWREADGAIIAGRAQGGRAEFAQLGDDGSMVWTLVPLGDANAN